MSRAPLSVIIPTMNSAESLPGTVIPLIQETRDGLIRELIVSDGGSVDGTSEIANEIGARFIISEQGRGTQLHAGARAARGDWFLFLHADTRLDDRWGEFARRHMESSNNAGFFRLRFSAPGPAAAWVAGWANRRSKWFDLPYGDQGLLISQDLYMRIGGYPEIPLMEDVEIARRLKGRLRMLDCTAATDPVRYLEDGWFRRGFGNLVLSARYLTGATPQEITSRYNSSRRKI